MRYYVSKKTGVYELCGLILQINMILVLNIVVINGKLLTQETRQYFNLWPTPTLII